VPLICAHRGGCGVDGLGAAESYRRAIELGVDFVEFDVRRRSDGVMVVSHDPLTAESAAQAMTLAEALEIAAGRVGLHLDLKETGSEAEVVGAALQRTTLDRLVITGEDAVIRTIKEQFPKVRAGLTLGEDLEGAPPWVRARVRVSELFPRRRLQSCRADFVAVHRQLAQLNVLRYCERVKIPAWVWTVNEEREIKRFLDDRRVTALITDRPDIAVRIRSG
jgi:glycerophosphoryl diester phosphodiesterase